MTARVRVFESAGSIVSAFSAGCCFGAQARANASSASIVPPLKIDDLTFPPDE
jgi:hypothetical protein